MCVRVFTLGEASFLVYHVVTNRVASTLFGVSLLQRVGTNGVGKREEDSKVSTTSNSKLWQTSNSIPRRINSLIQVENALCHTWRRMRLQTTCLRKPQRWLAEEP